MLPYRITYTYPNIWIPDMSNFASLLNQVQQTALRLSSTTSSVSQHNAPSIDEPLRKRSRQLDAKDFPSVERIVLLCPAGVQTGGPEALHQLCDQLNAMTTISAYIMYAINDDGRRSSSSSSSHPSCGLVFASQAKTPMPYRHYNAPLVSHDVLEGNGNSKELFIWPECWTNEMMDYLDFNPSPSQCAIWWLSVDNNNRRFKTWSRNDIIHLYQSDYAKDHLLNHGVKYVYPMTEYISHPISDSTENEDSAANAQDRSIDVLFNPNKGVYYTDAIRKRSEAILSFRPVGPDLGGNNRYPVPLTPQGVRDLLRQAKVYIDWGPHPGMDRLPREAALAGCLVVTNRQGSANYDTDVPIPPEYKVAQFDIDEIHKLLVCCVNEYQDRRKEFDPFREWIQQQESEMKKCVTNLVLEVVTKRIHESV
jgi:hypothetical protein